MGHGGDGNQFLIAKYVLCLCLWGGVTVELKVDRGDHGGYVGDGW